MSNMNAEIEQIRTARGSLQKFRLKLLRPSVVALESGSADLVVALECLKWLEPVLTSHGGRSVAHEQALELEVASLRRELQQVNALLDGAGKFYEGWSRLLACASDDGAANYTANGQPSASISNESNTEVIHG
jgi:hypothetical protein